MSFSQNCEEEVILKYFGSHIGNFLSIGENDGETLSNVRQLAINGWRGVCVEPCPEPFEKLERLYENNDKIDLYNVAIGLHNGIAVFYASGEHLGVGDSGLLSTLVKSEIDRWKGTEQFTEIEVEECSWEYMIQHLDLAYNGFKCDFISLDIEGKDVDVLEQMDLDAMETKMVCIEWNSNRATLRRINAKLKGWKHLHRNFENSIYVRT